MLRGVNLRVARGQAVAVLGPNGAGKSTLLRLVAGILYPSAGRVSVFGFDTVARNHEVRRVMSFVVNEERSFYWRLTGAQNLEYFAALDEVPRRVRRVRIDAVLDRVGLAGARDVRVASYSTGMRARLAVARGILPRPRLLVLDEPTRSLDRESVADVWRMLREANRRGTTLILATHDIREADAVCDARCRVSEGRIVKGTDHDTFGADRRAVVDPV